jgi:DNA gyrase subunit A
MSRQSKGRSIVNLLDMPATEQICAVVAVREFDASRFLVTATKRGQIKKTSLDAYSNVRKGGIQATGLDEGDQVIDVVVTRGNDEIILGTANGKAIRFKETDVRSMGRTAAGVRGVDLREGDEVVDMVLVDPMATLLTVCEHGYGKRTDFEEYRIQSRGGMGIINIKTTDRNGKVVAMKSIRDADELMIITQNGMIVRTGVSELRTIGRATQGVRIISLKPGDKLVGVARVVAEDNTQGALPLNNGDPEDPQPKLPLPVGEDEAPETPSETRSDDASEGDAPNNNADEESDGDVTNL